MKIKREWLEQLMFRGAASRRFTQDSPILPDVWIAYSEVLPIAPTERIDLLFTPHRDASAAALCHAIRFRLQADKEGRSWKEWHGNTNERARLAYHQSSAVAYLTFHELLRVVVPLSRWWISTIDATSKSPDIASYLTQKPVREATIDQLRRLEIEAEQPTTMRRSRARRATTPARPTPPPDDSPKMSIDLLWMIRVVGTMLLAARAKETHDGDAEEEFVELSRRYEDHIDEFSQLFAKLPRTEYDGPLLYTVSRNRMAVATISRSIMAVKGDAALRLFEIDTRNIAWAIVDSGVDATHPAFRKRDPATHKPLKPAFEMKNGKWVNNTHIAETFDFSRIRRVLDPEASEQERHDAAPAMTNRDKSRGKAASAVQLLGDATPPKLDPNTLADRARDVTNRLSRGGAIDWGELIPLFTVPSDDTYVHPVVDHGTHVAGILGGDWQEEHWPNEYPADEPDDLVGVCPGLTMYDLRVLDERGEGDEFTVMAALQFIRYLNSHRDQSVLQGANLSLSLRHDVANYACGRTPVCDECERVVASGVVVVAAAGNDGYMRFATPSGETEGYRSISISDPGNAEAVITVGATHRFAPHTYGVSYFSSRGPTGDGRVKPDLVAPGEKITAPVLNDGAGTKDGTSMAAPHVSGAAVLLMARNRELVGNPARIKQILCSTATNLGREHYFQGAGMVDVLRALQSV